MFSNFVVPKKKCVPGNLHCNCNLTIFWSRFYIVILGMTFFLQTIYSFQFIFGLFFPSSIWTFNSSLDFYYFFDFYFFFRLLFLFLTFISLLHKSRSDLGFFPSFFSTHCPPESFGCFICARRLKETERAFNF